MPDTHILLEQTLPADIILETIIKLKEQYDLLNARDIKEMLMHFLPKRKVSNDEIFRQMEIRHNKRRKYFELEWLRSSANVVFRKINKKAILQSRFKPAPPNFKMQPIAIILSASVDIPIYNYRL